MEGYDIMNDVQNILAGLMNNPCPHMGHWVKHNCPVCHNGQSGRVRGSYIFDNEGYAFHCFNCQFKAGWRPGLPMNNKLLDFAEKCGAGSHELMQLSLIAKDMADSGEYSTDTHTNSSIYQKITQRQLPSTAKTFFEWANCPQVPAQFVKVLESVYQRNKYLLDLDLYWCPDQENDLYRRYIIPYYINDQVIGYTARDTKETSKLKYFNQVNVNLFYNFDLLNDTRTKTIFVHEGVLDAALSGSLGIGSYEMSDTQIEQLKMAQERGKKVVIVPDRDKDGLKTINQALDNGFSVSLPDWGTKRTLYGVEYIKDFEEGTKQYGRLFSSLLVRKSIIDSEFEIKVLMNKWI